MKSFKIENHVGKVEIKGGEYSWDNVKTDEYGTGRDGRIEVTLEKGKKAIFSLDRQQINELIGTLIEIKYYIAENPWTVEGVAEQPVEKLIKVDGYPATFEFTIQDDLPEFNDEEGYCELRTEIVQEMMYVLNVYSPCHAYEDYIVESVEYFSEGEIWSLGS